MRTGVTIAQQRGQGYSIAWQPGLLLALASAVLFALNTHHGIGILPDTTRYMKYGPRPYDAPMYTWLLTAIDTENLHIIVAAHLLGFLLVCANSFLIWRLLNRGTGDNRHAMFGAALILFSPQFVGLHSVAMSEPLFIFVVLSAVLLFLKYVETDDRRWLLICGMMLGAAMLVRFTAAPLGAAFAVYLLREPGRQFAERLRRAAIVCGVGGGIFFTWALVSKLTTGRATGRDLEFYGNADWSRWLSGIDILSTYLLPAQIPWPIRFAVLFGAIAGVVWLSLRFFRQVPPGEGEDRRKLANLAIPQIFGLFSLFYFAFVILSVNIEANLNLNGRYALPLYVGMMMLGTIAVAKRRNSTPTLRMVGTVLVGLAAVMLAGHLVRTLKQTHEDFLEGIGFDSIAWQTSPTVSKVKRLPPDAVIYSNGADALNYIANRKTFFIPYRVQRRTGMDDVNNPFERQVLEMKGRLSRPQGYVVFLNRIDWRFYLVGEQELMRRLDLRLVDQEKDGRIYQIASFARPIPGGTVHPSGGVK